MRLMHWIVIVTAAGFVAGCQHHDRERERAERPRTPHTDDFPADDAMRPVWRVMEAQASAGAVEDGMLYAYHFDGQELNALGRDKLDLLMRSEARPLRVYVHLAEDEHTSARQTAIDRWLRAAGLEDDAIAIEAGANPASRSPAAAGLGRLSKTESPGAQTQETDGTMTTGNGR